MRWEALPATRAKIALAQKLVAITARLGWSRRALQAAAYEAFDDKNAWRALFPRGARDAIWFISDVSDASMREAFRATPARNIAEVIAERLGQNADLKSFVRRVMLFDFTHPLQALARMQRTAHVMLDCLPGATRRAGALSVSALNIAYTFVVFVWLFDRRGAATRTVTASLMKLIQL